MQLNMKYFDKIFVLKLITLSIIIQLCDNADQKEWGYKSGKSFKDPSRWKEIKGSSCGGNRQSPIDIKTNETQYWPVLSPINVTIYSNTSSTAKLLKDVMTLKLDMQEKWRISFGKDGCLTPFTIHWHWGSNDSIGSEHTLNGEMFPLEGHLVSYDCSIYKSSSDALNGPSGLYVIGFFYEIGPNDSTIETLLNTEIFSSEKKYVTINEINPRNFLPKDIEKYFRYEGSLTTPDCTENVIWTMMNGKLTIGKTQMEKFRTLKFDLPESGPMENNFRPVIPILSSSDYVKRVVYSSFNNSSLVYFHIILIYLSILMTTGKLFTA